MLWRTSHRIALTTLAALLFCGCQPVGSSGADEEKEPQFLIGRSRVNAMNYPGAIEAFERALELNPQSAAAHFELGWLYAEKQMDEAAAIYHYQKYLALRPGADNAETIEQHILRLKQELAKAALPIPPSSEIQRQLEHLTAENRRLQGELDQMQKALAQAQAGAGRLPLSGNYVTASARSGSVLSNSPAAAVGAPRGAAPHAAVSAMRSHRVQEGETLSSIARRYRVSVDALTAANPGLNPRRIKVGQILAIPSR
jgi:LysM repeat protein